MNFILKSQIGNLLYLYELRKLKIKWWPNLINNRWTKRFLIKY